MNLTSPAPPRPLAFPRLAVTRRAAVVGSCALTCITGLGDYATGVEIGFTLLYLLPIGVAAWFHGRRLAFAVSMASVAMSALTAMADRAEHSQPSVGVLVWNLAGELGVFVAFSYLLDALRRRIDSEVRRRESAVDQLRHADRLNVVGKMAAGIAHELGTPLSVVSGRASLIATGRATEEQAVRSAAVIVEQSERMTAILRQVLDFARRGGRQRTLRDVARIARETAALVEPLAKKSRVAITVADDACAIAPVDPAELQQVLMNLLVNAVQAMPSGGAIRINAGTERRDRRPFAFVRVEDEGTGIPEDVLPHVFDPFFTTKDVGKGTGLGLSVAFGIVRDHGGFIDVSSEVGKGAVFAVFLPQSVPDDAGS